MEGSDEQQEKTHLFQPREPRLFQNHENPLLAGRDFGDHDTPQRQGGNRK